MRCTTIPNFNNVSECLRFTLDFPDCRFIISQTFFTITNLNDFGKTLRFVELFYLFLLAKNLFQDINIFINFYTEIP